ncbi:hypothetical protein C4K30_3368 [Pseudomonas chlororaphis subsp. piscium]|nr:hypothetical protein C4K30_3368 [Pseudomonas chlororaphis subsp. piscium]
MFPAPIDTALPPWASALSPIATDEAELVVAPLPMATLLVAVPVTDARSPIATLEVAVADTVD